MPGSHTLLGLLITVLLAVHSARAWACPCATSADRRADEVLRRVLWIQGPEQVDLVVQWGLQGDARELAALVPVPQVPELLPAPAPDLFARLQAATAPVLLACEPATEGCQGTETWVSSGEDPLGWVEEAAALHIEAMLVIEDLQSLRAWMQQKSMTMSELAWQAAETDFQTGWVMVLVHGRWAGSPQSQGLLGPVHIRYRLGAEPGLNLSSLRVGHAEHVRVELYLAASTTLATGDVAQLQLDPSLMRLDVEEGSNYQKLRRRLFVAKGSGFLLEYAGPAPQLTQISQQLSDPLGTKKMVRLIAEYAPAAYPLNVPFESRAGLQSPAYPCLRAEPKPRGCQSQAPPAGLLLILLVPIVALRR